MPPILRREASTPVARGRAGRARDLPADGRDAVAAGDGALSTCTVCGASRIRKSSASVPSRSTAWARTPAGAGRRSAAVTSGSSRRTAEVKALLDSERCSSPAPYRQWRRAIRQEPGQASVPASSRGRTTAQP